VTPALIRTPTIDDAEALALVHVRCWIETYSGIVSPAVRASFSFEERMAAWTRILTSTSNPRHLAEVDGEVVGFSASGPARADDAPRELELYSIYVLGAHHGTGVGQQLIDAAVGREPAIVWVASENARAISFYRRNGFEPDGATGAFEPWENVPELRMTR
jgi:ribosomal protein S18 acetylase RimI-like enzyme